ncbi:MAG: hemolysin III family protein, partial [Vallitaleaceae bacterium]|nr:hemolysin III family protein [Vallitaleaceae bacterium]
MNNLFRLEVRKNFTRGEEFANSLTHGIGLLFGLVAWVLLVVKGVQEKDGLYLISVSVYSLSMIILFFNSMIYHGLRQNKKKDTFEKLDHASVYLLIAGTYTPFCLVTIGGTQGILLCIFQWTLALSGAVSKF